MPPKKKEIKEPDVEVPAGDATKGKALFDEQCSACHAIEVTTIVSVRVTISQLLLQSSEECSTGRPVQPTILSARL